MPPFEDMFKGWKEEDFEDGELNGTVYAKDGDDAFEPDSDSGSGSDSESDDDSGDEDMLAGYRVTDRSEATHESNGDLFRVDPHELADFNDAAREMRIEPQRIRDSDMDEEAELDDPSNSANGGDIGADIAAGNMAAALQTDEDAASAARLAGAAGESTRSSSPPVAGVCHLMLKLR